VTDIPVSANASFDLLTAGYVGGRTASTVSLVRDGDLCLVIDPGMVADRGLILDPLAALGVEPDDVTDVVFSHHHPDHTINAALFPRARYHDHWAIYEGDVWIDRPAEGYELSPSVRLIETPGHTPQDITTLIGTPDGVVAATHLWWHAQGPAEDPYATDPVALHAGRERVAALAAVIVPGHGDPFPLDNTVPR
jgi:glyoxylase-like metal-dependent hydrolase (beta-lactamase superfamily II)